MKAFLPALLSITFFAHSAAARNRLKPTDFEPLTSLPWKQAGATLEGSLDTIFREPSVTIRYPVLAEYLRTMPVAQLGKALDVCIALEGTEKPDALVEFFLPIWAKRDPTACWKRTKHLFDLVGMTEGWLSYDSWIGRPRITVQNLAAIRASKFWLERTSSLMGFGLGVDASALPKKERLRLMKEFAARWFDAFGTWPGYVPPRHPGQGPWLYDDSKGDLIEMFEASAEDARGYVAKAHYSTDAPAVEIALRRWMQAEPQSALEILKIIREIKWTPYGGWMPWQVGEPSTELLMIWAKADLSAMLDWAELLGVRKDPLALTAKSFLMSRVDAVTRARWLAEAKSAEPEENNRVRLLEDWARWAGRPGLDAAVATQDAETINEVANSAAYGPGYGQLWNTCHFGLGVLKEFDVTALPEPLRHETIQSDWEEIMEQWGDVDIGEAARYGVGFLMSTGYAPRERVLRFFSGHEEYPDEGGMIDRTFCALRVWAVVRPDEMKNWISTLKEADLRKALTWLRKNPWGRGAKM